MMPHIGCHLSPSAGLLRMGERALSIGADTLQFFLRNPRGSRAKAFDAADAGALMRLAAEHAFAPMLAHAPYTLNPCSSDARVAEFARMTLADDLARAAHFPGLMYNLHPGSHGGAGAEAGIARAAALIGSLAQNQPCLVLIETMSGQGAEIGGTFQELAALIDQTGLPSDRLGVCLDTCHAFAAGYDVANDPDGVLTEFDRRIGLSRLKAVHLNDSLTPPGSRRDRHARIGEGQIGLAALVRLLRHPALASLPFILETPNDLPGYAAEIALLRETAPA